MALTRILFASDFHGSNACFRKFVSAGLTYQANVMIVGGDVTGKGIIPIIHHGKGVYEGYLFGAKNVCETAEELNKFKEQISNVGFYPLVLEPDEARELEADHSKMDEVFGKLMNERVIEWLELAEKYLKPKGIKMFFMPGNDDSYVIDEVIGQSEYVINPDERICWIDDYHEVAGLGSNNMTPWKCPRDMAEEELDTRIENLAARLEKPENAIFAFHCPPYDSLLDTAPDLDKDLRIKTAGGQVLMKPVGSTAVRNAIKKWQPLLSLHGHIHEAAGHTRIGKTLAINPGSEYAEGIMKAALVNLDRDKVKGHMIISG
ncbi:MAG: metallophosphoesterase [Firmicutes bacterium]|nr:metallophosphoesterase [Bacillota bacterium]